MWYNVDMAAFITHELIAGEVFDALSEEEKEKIRCVSAFYAGAQGGDCFFLYRPLSGNKNNLGRLMHRKNIYGFFCAAKDYAEKTGDYSYIFGYITHYAADTVFHPFVYATEYRLLSTLKKQRKKDKVHFLIERDIDAFLYEKFGKNRNISREIDEQGVACAYGLLRYAAEKAYGVTVNKNALRRALKRFFRQQSYLADPDGTRRKRVFALERKLHLRHFFSYMFLRRNPDVQFEVLRCGDEEKSVYRLYDEAKERSLFLIRAFLRENKPDKNDFSVDFNKGKK